VNPDEEEQTEAGKPDEGQAPEAPAEAPAAQQTEAASDGGREAPAGARPAEARRSDRERDQDRDDDDGDRRGRRRHFGRRRVCTFCVDKVESIDYKDPGKLRRYVSDRGRIEARRRTGTCAKHQRWLATALKRARHLALLPYTPEHIRLSGSFAPRREGGPPRR
jgi:small subunit ribosomal protein S18